MGYAIIEYRNEAHPIVHTGFETDADAVFWAGEHLAPGGWEFAMTVEEKPSE
jgi:hypothetical protein